MAFAHPFCATLRGVLCRGLRRGQGPARTRRGTYVCIEGPQFSTRAESELYRSWGMDVIGMTNLQEARLAREAEICYAHAGHGHGLRLLAPRPRLGHRRPDHRHPAQNAASAKAVLRGGAAPASRASRATCECATRPEPRPGHPAGAGAGRREARAGADHRQVHASRCPSSSSAAWRTTPWRRPFGRAERVLGGSASFFAVAASFFAPVNLVGVVGEDFGEKQLAAFAGRAIDLEGLERVPGKTFHWAGQVLLRPQRARDHLHGAQRLRVLQAQDPRALPALGARLPGQHRPRAPAARCSTRWSGRGSWPATP